MNCTSNAFYEECLKSLAKCSAVNSVNVENLNGKDSSKVMLRVMEQQFHLHW